MCFVDKQAVSFGRQALQPTPCDQHVAAPPRGTLPRDLPLEDASWLSLLSRSAIRRSPKYGDHKIVPGLPEYVPQGPQHTSTPARNRCQVPAPRRATFCGSMYGGALSLFRPLTYIYIYRYLYVFLYTHMCIDPTYCDGGTPG